MSREIKFRAWSGKEYHHQDDQYLSSFIWRFVRDVNYENGLNSEHEAYLKSHLNNYLEQFTGLTDKNGVEIYEGDILEINEKCFLVRFFEGGFCLFKSKADDAWKYEDWENLRAYAWCSFITGNIHENPDLLENNNEST